MKQLLPWLLLPASLVISADNPVPDPALAAAITKYLPVGQPEGPLTPEKLESMILVNARDTPIRDLSGLERCTKLQFLFLAGSQASDLTPLAKLERLESLTISMSKVRDVTPLAGLTNLQYLDLSGNEISDLKPLAKLTMLKDLNLSGNRIADLAPLAGLTALQSLTLDDNQVIDLAPLAGLKTLTNLSVRRNKVVSAAPLADMNVEILHLDRNQITDLTPLVAMFRQPAPSSRPAFLYRSLTIRENPLSADAVAHQVPELGKYIFDVQADRAPR
jgi:Leucine-rich repeat (LRR) protein